MESESWHAVRRGWFRQRGHEAGRMDGGLGPHAVVVVVVVVVKIPGPPEEVVPAEGGVVRPRFGP